MSEEFRVDDPVSVYRENRASLVYGKVVSVDGDSVTVMRDSGKTLVAPLDHVSLARRQVTGRLHTAAAYINETLFAAWDQERQASGLSMSSWITMMVQRARGEGSDND